MVFFALLVWIVLSLLVASVATKKGRSFIAFLLLSLITSPLISAIILLVLGEDSTTIDKRELSKGITKKCPQCAETVKAEAKICRYCNHEFAETPAEIEATASSHIEENVKAEEEPVRTRSDLEPSFSDLVQKIDKGIIVIFVGLLVVMGGLYSSQQSSIESALDYKLHFSNDLPLLESNFSTLSPEDRKIVNSFQAPNPESWPIEDILKIDRYSSIGFEYYVSLTIPTLNNPDLQVSFIQNNEKKDNQSKYFVTISLDHPDGTERRYTIMKSLWKNRDILDRLKASNDGNLHSVYDHLTKLSVSYGKFCVIQHKRAKTILDAFFTKRSKDLETISSDFHSYYIYALVLFGIVLVLRILMIISQKVTKQPA